MALARCPATAGAQIWERHGVVGSPGGGGRFLTAHGLLECEGCVRMVPPPVSFTTATWNGSGPVPCDGWGSNLGKTRGGGVSRRWGSLPDCPRPAGVRGVRQDGPAPRVFHNRHVEWLWSGALRRLGLKSGKDTGWWGLPEVGVAP